MGGSLWKPLASFQHGPGHRHHTTHTGYQSMWFYQSLHSRIHPVNKTVVNFSCFCCHLLIFFQNKHFQKILSGTLSESQTVWIQIRTDALLVLMWVQIVCKCYQQTTKVTASKERVKRQTIALPIFFLWWLGREGEG